MAHMSKRTYNALQDIKNTGYRSLKSDNRVFCRQANMRAKFYYATEKKAEIAIRFGQQHGLVRYYYCSSCVGFHTTSKEKHSLQSQH